MSKRQEKSVAKCTLCKGKNQSNAKTDACSHLFCFTCLKKWAKKEDRCPQCDQKFNKIAKVKVQTSPKGRPLSPRSKSQQEEAGSDQGESVEENIFSIINGPETRNSHVKFLQLYSIFDGLIDE